LVQAVQLATLLALTAQTLHFLDLPLLVVVGAVTAQPTAMKTVIQAVLVVEVEALLARAAQALAVKEMQALMVMQGMVVVAAAVKAA
jgi:hypothetical protein